MHVSLIGFLKNTAFSILVLLIATSIGVLLLGNVCTQIPTDSAAKALLCHLSTFFSNVMPSISAAILLWIILGFYIYFASRKRSRFIRMFCLHACSKIVFKFSNAKIWTKKGSALAESCPHGEMESGICSFTEISSINYITKELQIFPSATLDSLRGLVDSLWNHNLPEINFDCSPYYESCDCKVLYDEINCTCNTLILVGSSNKNLLRRSFVKMNKPKMRFIWEDFSEDLMFEFNEREKAVDNYSQPIDIKLRKKHNYVIARHKGKESHIDFDGKYNLAIVEKVICENHITFFCTGVRADDSFEAVRWLFRNWQKFYDKEEFAVCIGIKFNDLIRDCSTEYPVICLATIVKDKLRINTDDLTIKSNEQLSRKDFIVLKEIDD